MSSGRSGLFSDGTVDYDGSIPGWRRGKSSARPATGMVPGDMYLAYDTQILYWWDGTTWQVALSPGGGGPQDIQSVLGVGNVTSLDQIFDDGAGNTIQTGLAGCSVLWQKTVGPLLIGAVVVQVQNTGPVVSFYQGTVGRANLQFSLLTAIRNNEWPDASGILQVSGNGLKLPIRSTAISAALTRFDYTILCDTTGGSITITLPATAAITGCVYNIKVKVITANNITVAPAAGNIDGAATATISCAALNSMQVQFDGTNYWIL